MACKKGTMSLGVSEFILIFLALLFGAVIFIYLTEKGGFLHATVNFACTIGQGLVEILHSFGVKEFYLCAAN